MAGAERATFGDAWLRQLQVRELPDRPQRQRGSKHCTQGRNALLACLVLSIVRLPRNVAAARKPRARHRR